MGTIILVALVLCAIIIVYKKCIIVKEQQNIKQKVSQNIAHKKELQALKNEYSNVLNGFDNNNEKLKLIDSGDLEQIQSVKCKKDYIAPKLNLVHEKQNEQIAYLQKCNVIEWTAELRHVESIMLLASKSYSRKADTGNVSFKKYYEKYNSLTLIEQYELTKLFAQRIVQADDMRNKKMFNEERLFCIETIKWCARNGVSVVYWQTRLNQTNELLGLKKIAVLGQARGENSNNKKFLSATDKYELDKATKEKFEKEYSYYRSINDERGAQRVVRSAIKWAECANQPYYKGIWEKRIIKKQKSKPLKNKGLRQINSGVVVASPQKPRRPRILISKIEKTKD